MSLYYLFSKIKGLSQEEANTEWLNNSDSENEGLTIEQILSDLKKKSERILKNKEKFDNKNSGKKKSGNIIGGLEEELYLSPPKKFQESWIFYIPRCDFNQERYRELLPIIENSFLPYSYGKLLPESYYYGVLKQINNKFFIDLDYSKVTEELNDRISKIYSVAKENGYISEIYPSEYNIDEYKKCIDIIMTNPNSDWSKTLPIKYQFIYGGVSGFKTLLQKKQAYVNL